MKKYEPKVIEPKWQKIWQETNLYTPDLNSDKPKYFGMDMFNYPSALGLHIGHAFSFTISDVISRYHRQKGYNTFLPVGWDAFGLPAENYAVKVGRKPQDTTKEAIQNYRNNYEAMGFSRDWTREINTSEPEYYRWNQWLFLKLHEQGLAYQSSALQWWCDNCQTVLANEQVTSDNKCWRHETAEYPEIYKKEIKQWFFKVTEYADELLDAIDDLDWTESTKLAQKNWIGRSEGAEIKFKVHKVCNPNPKLARTYIMGQKNITEGDIKSIGGKVESVTNSGHLCVEFPIEKSADFENLINNKMEPGFWNEYLTNEKVIFIFKHKDGQLQRFELNDDNAHDICALGNKFNNDPEPKLEETAWDWLSDNNWYAPIVPSITVFTTRADTLFGATFMVLAPEHELALSLTTPERRNEVENYIKLSAKKTEVERQAAKEKTGVFTGAYAINPINNEAIPIYVADYVLGGYGTGAIMAVPAHDERDYEFAQKFDLPIQSVIAKDFGEPLPDAKDVTGSVVIGYDPNTQEFMSVLNGKLRWLVGGSLEEGETYEDAARRELKEEAGFDNVESLIQLGDPTYSYYYNSLKDSNRRSFSYMYLAIINRKNQGEQKLESHENFKVVWSDLESILVDFQKEPDGRGHWIESLGRVKKALQSYENSSEYGPDLSEGEGILFNSDKFNGLSTSEAREKIVTDLEKKGLAKLKVNYKMRDWSVSRQRYWGTPIPVIHCEDCGSVMVPEEDLPVVLPDLDNFQPSEDGGAPLSRATDWINTTCPKCGGPAKRETETMDTFVDSSWYMFRYLSPNYTKGPFDPELAKHWFPVDFYDGADHATMHLLYSRFITRFFYKLGMSPTPEPFKKFLFHGKVTAHDGTMFSKSKGNGVDPLEVINSGYGADALRLYEMFAAPLDLWIKWNPEGVPAMYRFLNRFWSFVQEYLESSEVKLNDSEVKKLLFVANKTTKKVSHDIEKCLLNTAIASVMAALNNLTKLKTEIPFGKNDAWRQTIETILMCIAPFAPHVADELWQQLGHSDSIHKNHWPEVDENYLQEDEITIALMVNGKLRAELKLNKDAGRAEMEKAALANPRIQEFLNGKEPKKVIVVPGRLVNFVV